MTADESARPTDALGASETVAALALPTLSHAQWQHLAALPGLLLWAAPTQGSGEMLPSWYAYTGQDQGAPDGHEWLEAIHPEDRSQVAALWSKAQSAPGPFISAFRLCRADGTYQPMTLSATPSIDAIGVVRGWVGWGVAHPALDTAGDQANDQAQQLQNLQALTDTALTHLSLDELLHELLERIQEVMQVDNVAILLLDAAGQDLRIRAVLGVEEAVAEQVRVPLGQGFAGTIAASKKPLIVNDLSTFSLVNTYLGEHLCSLAGVPLLVEDRVLGVVHVGAVQLGRFTEDDVPLLQRVADRVALAIDRANVYEEAERTRAEVALRAQQLETVFETLVDGLIVYDEQGNTLQMNGAARALLGLERQPGFTLEQVAEQTTVLDMRNERGDPLTLDQWPIPRILKGEVLKGLGAMDVQLLDQGGHDRQISVSGSPVRDQHGKIVGAVAVLHDVTERRKLTRQTHDALEAVLEMAEALVSGPGDADTLEEPLEREAGPVARQLADLTCRVLGCARVGISRLDVESDLLLPLAVAGLSPEQEKQWWLEQQQQQVPLHASPDPGMVAQLEAGDVLQFDLTQPPYQNQPNPYGITTMLIVPLRIKEQLLGLLSLDHAGLAHVYTPDEQRLALAVARLTALVIDRERLLRERAAAESRALALLEANQRLETFISIVSHELRTPVTSLKANLQLILRRVKQGKDAAESAARFSQQLDLLERMEHQMRRLTRLLDDVIDVARIRTGKLEITGEPYNLSKLVTDIVRTEQVAYPGRTIQLEPLPAEEVPVLIDPDRVEQVITNYLTNALKYSAAQQPVEVGLTLEQDQARVWVRDHGPGISPAEQARIWELFHRVPGIEVQSGSGVGLGLGLHISKSLIEQHGGKVGVESTPGIGSTFWFTLPLASASHKHA